jgi:hypothetical protein
MNAVTRHSFAVCYATLVGGIDFCTGLALIAVPAFTLDVMGAAVPGTDALVFVRFVGVFVASVGASYLWASLFARAESFRTVLQLTLLFRLGAGTFTGVAVLAAMLGTAWLAVTATDLTCVLVQAWLLMRGVDRE